MVHYDFGILVKFGWFQSKPVRRVLRGIPKGNEMDDSRTTRISTTK